MLYHNILLQIIFLMSECFTVIYTLGDELLKDFGLKWSIFVL